MRPSRDDLIGREVAVRTGVDLREVRERPILFSRAMVRAIGEGRKTQTRRLVTRAALQWLDSDGFLPEFVASPGNRFSPYGYPGDRLWVRETYWGDATTKAFKWYVSEVVTPDRQRDHCKLIPGIFMPRVLSRITLEVLGVRIERLQLISDRGAIAEGADQVGDNDGAFRAGFERLWDSINGKRAPWSSDPWVWVVEFKRAPSL